MRNKKTYFAVLVILAAMILVGMLMNVPYISNWVRSLQGMTTDWRVAVAAIICALVCARYNNFWTVMLGCALVVAVIVQFIFFGSNIDLYAVAIRMVWFLIVAYLVDYSRMILKL